MKKIIFNIEENEELIRIDLFLANNINDKSRSYIQKLIKDKKVLVNSKQVKSNYIIRIDDKIEVEIPDNIIPDIVPENIELDIVYEDEDLLIVNKPKNMVVHPACGHYSSTLVNALMYHCKDRLSGINGVLRPGIVHRIDKDTTGLLIVCKNDLAHESIAEQLKNHSINREYRAIVYGNLENKEKTINKPIARSKKDRKKMAVDILGKEAITHFEIIKQFKDFAYISCKLETGRTHQIRVHLASIGNPLLGDEIYSSLKSKINTQGQCLHAMTLGFIHPRTKEYLEFSSQLPEYFENILSNLK